MFFLVHGIPDNESLQKSSTATLKDSLMGILKLDIESDRIIIGRVPLCLCMDRAGGECCIMWTSDVKKFDIFVLVVFLDMFVFIIFLVNGYLFVVRLNFYK
jgi:hypothetical protein